MKKTTFVLLLLYSSIHAFTPIIMINKPNTIQPKLKYYYEITKPKYSPYSFGLPLVGTYISSNNIFAIAHPQVLLTGMISLLISANYIIMNIYHNHKNKINKDDEDIILKNRLLKREDILKMYSILNIVSFYLIIYFMKSYLIKILLVNNIVLSYIYTPYINRIPLLKNIAKAGIISQSLILGSIASNIYSCSLLPATLYVFSLIMWKDLNTDIINLYKDKKYKIKTLPTLIGVFHTHLLSFFFLLLGILIPYGTKSHLFILLHSPLILNSIRLIYTRKIIDKKYLSISNVIMTMSGIHMCLI